MVNNGNNRKTYSNVFHSPLISGNGGGMYFHDVIHNKVTHKQEVQILPILLLLYKILMQKKPCNCVSTCVCSQSWPHDHKVYLYTLQIKRRFLLTNELLQHLNGFFSEYRDMNKKSHPQKKTSSVSIFLT